MTKCEHIFTGFINGFECCYKCQHLKIESEISQLKKAIELQNIALETFSQENTKLKGQIDKALYMLEHRHEFNGSANVIKGAIDILKDQDANTDDYDMRLDGN